MSGQLLDGPLPPHGREPVPLLAVSGLGVATMVAYGAWFYAFGVLVDVIAADTGWSLTSLGATYAAASLLTGAFAAVAGRWLDRFGARPLLLAGGIVGAGLLALAAQATSVWAFGALYGIGGGVVGAFGFYHFTMAASARLAGPAGRARAVALLTIWGAFASPIFLPGTAWLVQHLGWRDGQRILAATVAVGFGLAAALSRGIGPVDLPVAVEHPITTVRAAIRLPAVRRMLQAEIAAGLGIGALLVYQVPVMTAAGLGLSTAAGLAGARGLLQLLGRLPLTPVIDRFGVRPSLVASFALVSASGVLLGFAGNLGMAIAYAIVAGAALGAMSPLSGLYAQELFAPEHLGLLMGARASVRQVFWAIGPLVTGALIDLSGSTLVAVAIVVVSGAVAAVRLGTALPEAEVVAGEGARTS